MVLIKYTTPEGKEEEIYIDENLQKNIVEIKDSVLNKGWDNPFIICGICGVGKSTFGQQFCKALDDTFNIDRICFTAEEFCEKTSKGNKGEAYMLDESFADMNSKASTSPEFIKIMNHLQLIRQRGLHLCLILPDFFSLNKNVAIFRANYLFVIYHSDYKRGRFAVFDRERKKNLYIKGKQFLNYMCVPPNFRGRFVGKWVIDEKEYERRKYNHLVSQGEGKNTSIRTLRHRDKLFAYTKLILNIPSETLSEVSGIPIRVVNLAVAREKEDILKRFGGKDGN